MAGLHGDAQLAFCKRFMCRKGQEIRNKDDRRKYQLEWHPDRPQCKTSTEKAAKCRENFQNMNACIEEAKYYCDGEGQDEPAMPPPPPAPPKANVAAAPSLAALVKIMEQTYDLIVKAEKDFDYYLSMVTQLEKFARILGRVGVKEAHPSILSKFKEQHRYAIYKLPVYEKLWQEFRRDMMVLVKYAYNTPPGPALADKVAAFENKVDFLLKQQKGDYTNQSWRLKQFFDQIPIWVRVDLPRLVKERKVILDRLAKGSDVPKAVLKAYEKEIKAIGAPSQSDERYNITKKDRSTMKKNYLIKLEPAAQKKESAVQKKEKKESAVQKKQEEEEDEPVKINRKPRKRPKLDDD